ncbi:efflux RND transporter permease subunit [Rhizomicrobium electricum]|uniref:Efflux RND transporter permease subunit n=1 Tax=Rhizomicrobium electricum TaxID=480070 RepID=A0ABN1E7W8_9PROT|nr:efflux RND transporter permease subunit [Rhizomicrobium electricum]NIJ47869.1 CzcA family heavy metal efflux pump [Rhizomicrobium electricum]
MNALVRVALERPYTFIVMALLILIVGPLAAIRTPTDIFPNIGVPVIGVAFQYTGLSPDEMSGRIITPYERVLTTTVNDIEHIESTSLPGMGIVKIYFQPNVDIRTATAQVTSISQTILKFLPPGATPPLILNYNASTVPILQLASSGLPEQQVLDLTQNFARPVLSTVPGAAIPFSYGGRVRQVQVDLDPQALQAKGLSAQDVGNAIAAQNQITPSGTVKIGALQYTVKLNNAAQTIQDLNNLPVKTVNGAVVYLRDVGHVRDGAPPQQSLVHVNGERAVLTTILKTGAASTLDVVQGVKDVLPKILDTMPPSFKLTPLNDQSLFVTAAVSGVVREGIIAAALTSLMILLFLGSWRSTVIIATSIPLAILAALAALSAMGQTLNIMTLGGLALAIGILVDDATVTIENVNWHLEQGKPVLQAILDGAQQIVTPAFVSLLCICIVFVPMFALTGVAGYLFVPMAEAVIFAMIASFILSRTLVPTMAMYLLRPHAAEAHIARSKAPGPLVRFQQGFTRRFEQTREGYRNLLAMAMAHRAVFVAGFMVVVVLSFALVPFLGSNFFPSVDSGQITIHARPPVGTRLEQSAAIFGNIEKVIRATIPPKEVSSIVDNLGLPTSSINTIYNNSGLIGYQDGDIYISLNENHHATADYVRRLRERLPAAFPGVTFSFLPADIVSQILNFGSPAPIDVQIAGPKLEANQKYAAMFLRKLRAVRGVADARIQQSEDNPQLRVDVDRSRIAGLGLTERDVTNSLTTSLAGSSQVAPTFWLDPKSGVSYPIVAQMPEYEVASLSALSNVPITGANGGLQVLGGLARISRETSSAVVSHYNVRPVVDLYAAAQDRDLGGIAADVRKLIAETKADVPKGATVTLRGQAATMDTAFTNLYFGILAALVLIYLLIVVNFQSWLDPFVIITALPAALAGIVWMLFVTGTTLSVPALTGAIMCMGVGTANSILVVSFARERLAVTGNAALAAMEAGLTRFRPVLMTALAMIIGMAPMALGLGEGGEQNAPLGRAVIGGLIFATSATLIFVPVVFSIVHGRRSPAARAVPRSSTGEAYA